MGVGRRSAVAIKKVEGQDRESAKAFSRELMIACSLQHPNIVPLLGFCVDQDGLFLVYKYVSGGSLDHHLHPQPHGTLFFSSLLLIFFLYYLSSYSIEQIFLKIVQTKSNFGDWLDVQIKGRRCCRGRSGIRWQWGWHRLLGTCTMTLTSVWFTEISNPPTSSSPPIKQPKWDSSVSSLFFSPLLVACYSYITTIFFLLLLLHFLFFFSLLDQDLLSTTTCSYCSLYGGGLDSGWHYYQ